tara:strand:- start:929 stop:3469 length:2541 start_codon:yes stop_codon:yes gene_type:complete
MKLILTFFISFIFLNSYAQYSYFEVDTTIKITIDGRFISDPFTGGYNTAQVNAFDVNQDGIMDWIVYDRAGGLVRPYINRGIPDSVSYYYAPEYASKFPPLRDFFRTADFNGDGKMDIYDGSSNIQVWENKSTLADGIKFELVTKLKSLYNPSNSLKLDINPGRENLPGIYDIDNDGDLELFMFDVDPRNVSYHRDLSKERGDTLLFDYERRNTCWGNFIEGGVNNAIFLDTCIGPNNPPGEISEGTSDNKQLSYYSKSSKHAGSTVNPIDIDNNGTMDLLIADIDAYELKLLLNDDTTGRNSHIYAVESNFPNYDVPVDILFPAAYFLDINNDGFNDMLNASNVSNPNSTLFPLGYDDIYYYENIATDGSFLFHFKQNDFLLNQTLDFGRNCYPIFFDHNNDGLLDLLIGNDGYVDSTKQNYIGQLALFENIGTVQVPRFKLIDLNYLNLPSLNLDLIDNKPARNIIPTAGDIDGDGDYDLLIGESNNNVFFFEDTSLNGQPAAFKFHPKPFQGINFPNFSVSNSLVLHDINEDGLLDLIVSASGRSVNYFINFGTSSNPIFNIELDSIEFLQGSKFRYHLKDIPNYSFFKIGDTLATNGSSNLNNNPFIELILTEIDSTNHYFECNSTLQTQFDASYNSSDGFINFFNREWGYLYTSTSSLNQPRIFPYKDASGETHLIVLDGQGKSYFFNNIPAITPGVRDTFELQYSNYLLNYGINASIGGADLNNDGIVDLAIGNEAGGFKLLFGTEPVGLLEFNENKKQEQQLFKVYPNPTNNIVTIELITPSNEAIEYKIIDMGGRMVRQANFKGRLKKLDLSSFPKGIYFIQLQSKNTNSTTKLILTP